MALSDNLTMRWFEEQHPLLDEFLRVMLNKMRSPIFARAVDSILSNGGCGGGEDGWDIRLYKPEWQEDEPPGTAPWEGYRCRLDWTGDAFYEDPDTYDEAFYDEATLKLAFALAIPPFKFDYMDKRAAMDDVARKHGLDKILEQAQQQLRELP